MSWKKQNIQSVKNCGCEKELHCKLTFIHPEKQWHFALFCFCCFYPSLLFPYHNNSQCDPKEWKGGKKHSFHSHLTFLCFLVCTIITSSERKLFHFSLFMLCIPSTRFSPTRERKKKLVICELITIMAIHDNGSNTNSNGPESSHEKRPFFLIFHTAKWKCESESLKSATQHHLSLRYPPVNPTKSTHISPPFVYIVVCFIFSFSVFLFASERINILYEEIIYVFTFIFPFYFSAGCCCCGVLCVLWKENNNSLSSSLLPSN